MTDLCSIGAGGAVRLGGGVVADGFDSDAQVRVQTHVHGDHMAGFDSSKGNGVVVCSHPTRDLLIATKSKFLRFAANVVPLDLGAAWTAPSGAAVTLLDARHMSGSSQVLVEHPGGMRTAYSGDFSWPCDPVESPDELVLDATYGSPTSVRMYSQAQAEERFVEEALARLKNGPVSVKAHRGTLQRAIALLAEATTMPLLGSSGQCAESAVWAAHGHAQGTLVDIDCAEGHAAAGAGRYVVFYGTGDRLPDLRPGEHRITLSAFGAPELDPYLAISERHCRVALSDHADFDGTLEYVATAKPRAVLTDASRSPHAVVLAEQITSRLGIPARAVDADTSALGRGWA
jgi:Cft2 family RNA processing exonuclease